MDNTTVSNQIEEGPSRKKRRTMSGQSDSSSGAESANDDINPLQQIVAEEIDLEIAIRQRLAETIDSRITWALLLQEALNNEFHVKGDPDQDFQEDALDALNAIESFCSVLFSHESRPPHKVIGEDSEYASVVSAVMDPKPEPGRHRIRRRAIPQNTPSRPKLLFIRHHTGDESVVAKIACTDCDRVDFPNLQGLFNHCRLKHKREYGSHDECIQNCAVVVSGEEKEWVMEHGTEISAVNLPSLRRLFEIAVGGPQAEINRGYLFAGRDIREEVETSGGSVHLTRTLGLHKDTPALAPFLGRAPKRRCINVYDEDKDVDIGGDNQDATSIVHCKPSWRMAYTHRNIARPELDTVIDTPDATTELVSTGPLTQRAIDTIGTRFHIVARVVVADRSLWLPPDRRPPSLPEHTHRWMLSVHSPSYSLDISAFLAKMTVTCMTDPPPSTFTTPIIISDLPFFATSTTDKPFLARLKLEWVGAQNPSMEVEHWVELDELRAAQPALGDEQLLNIELDRNTDLLPVRNVGQPSDWMFQDKKKNQANVVPLSIDDGSLPNHIKALKSLLPRVPLTMKDIKGRSRPQVQYKLVSSHAQLSSLLPGRRKAIEWGRARTLRDAYQQEYSSIKDDYMSLTTAQVFRWLESEGLFLRPAVAKQVKSTPIRTTMTSTSSDSFCPVCGFSLDCHRYLKTERSNDVSACPLADKHISRTPLLDVNRLLGRSSDLRSNTLGASYGLVSPPRMSAVGTQSFEPSNLIGVSDPSLTVAILKLVNTLGLSSFPVDSPQRLETFPLLRLGGTKKEVEERLAPYALLTLVLKPFVRCLIRSALAAAKKQGEIMLVRDGGRRSGVSRFATTRLLTPTHVMKSLGDNLPRGPMESVIMLALCRLGVESVLAKLDTASPEEDDAAALSQHQPPLLRIKCEDEV